MIRSSSQPFDLGVCILRLGAANRASHRGRIPDTASAICPGYGGIVCTRAAMILLQWPSGCQQDDARAYGQSLSRLGPFAPAKQLQAVLRGDREGSQRTSSRRSIALQRSLSIGSPFLGKTDLDFPSRCEIRGNAGLAGSCECRRPYQCPTWNLDRHGETIGQSECLLQEMSKCPNTPYQAILLLIRPPNTR